MPATLPPGISHHPALVQSSVPTGIPGADPGAYRASRFTHPLAQQPGFFPALAASRSPAAAADFYGSAVIRQPPAGFFQRAALPSSPVPTRIQGAHTGANHGARFTRPAAPQAGIFPVPAASYFRAPSTGFSGASPTICKPPPGFSARATHVPDKVPTGISRADPGATHGARFTQPAAPQAGLFAGLAASRSPAPAPAFHGRSAVIRQPPPGYLQRAALPSSPVPTGIPGADPGADHGAGFTWPAAPQAGLFAAPAASRSPAPAPAFHGGSAAFRQPPPGFFQHAALPPSPVTTGIPGADPGAFQGARFNQPAAPQAGGFPAPAASRSAATEPGFGGSAVIRQPPPGFLQRAALPSSPVPTLIPGADPGGDHGAGFTWPAAPQPGVFPAPSASRSAATAPGFGGSAAFRQPPPGFFQRAALSPSPVPTGNQRTDPGATHGARSTQSGSQAGVFPAAAASRSPAPAPSFHGGSAAICQPPPGFSQRPVVRPSTLPLEIIQASATLNKEPQMTQQQSCQDQVGRGATNKSQVFKHLRLSTSFVMRNV